MELAKGYKEPEGYQTCAKCNQKKPSPKEFNHYEPDCMPPTCNSCCWINMYHTLWNGTGIPCDPFTGKPLEDAKPKERTKACGLCREELPFSRFYDRKGSKDGKHYNCKSCMKLKVSNDRKGETYHGS